jgi:hypothetical protein
VRDHSSVHQVDEERRQPCFNDVAAEHYYDGALVSGGFSDRVHYAEEILRHQNMGQRFQEGSEAAISAWSGCEFGGGKYVGAPCYWNGADFGEIGFRDGLGRRAPFLRPRRFVWSRAGTAVTAYGFGDGK